MLARYADHVYLPWYENLGDHIEHHIDDIFNQYQDNLQDEYISARDLVYQLHLDEDDCLGDDPQDKLDDDGNAELYDLETIFQENTEAAQGARDLALEVPCREWFNLARNMVQLGNIQIFVVTLTGAFRVLTRSLPPFIALAPRRRHVHARTHTCARRCQCLLLESGAWLTRQQHPPSRA